MAEGATKSHIPLVEPASEPELREIADSLKLGINDDDLKEYTKWVNMSLGLCDALREIPETMIPVFYPRTPGMKPTREDNPLNAWATKVTIKGESTGLLAGKKIAIKDNIYVAGVPLQNGSKIWDGYTPEFDATAVTRILKAGGTITGKTTCENMCFSGGSFTSASGPVLNPHDKTRQCGGSSSGSAALVVAGEVDMALGGDQGGSVRLPSCWTGCVGLKPTWGLVPVTGSIGMEPTVDHIGPMANTVSDVALLLEVIAGYDDGRDHRQIPNLPIPQYTKLLRGDLQGKKFAYVTEGFLNATPGVKATIDGVLGQMKAAGAVVDVISITEHQTFGPLFMASMPSFYNSMFRNHGQGAGYKEFYNKSAGVHLKKALETHAHDLQPVVKAVALFGEYVNKKDHGGLVAMAMNQRPLLRAAYDRALEKYDGLIMPTIKSVARKVPPANLGILGFIGEAFYNTQNTGMQNLTGHPVISLSVGKVLPEDEDGQAGTIPLPVGLMIIGSHFEEAKLLDLAYGVEKLVQSS